MSSESDRRTLGWAERPGSELLRLTWPIAVSMISYAVMTLADTLFVGRIGPAAIAGVGLGGVAAFTTICFVIGMLRGTKVLVSQAMGADRSRDAERHAGAGLALGVGLGAVAGVVGLGVAELLPSVAATVESGAAARTYLSVRMLGTPIVMAYVALREVRYGRGDSRRPMVASVVGNLANVALDALFVLVLEWGVAGAAWATVIGQSVELGLLAGLGGARGLAMPRARELRALWRIGVPTGVQFFLEVGAFALLATLLAALDEREMAAHQIALQVLHFAFLPVFAVGEAASVLVGQAVGADRFELIRGVTRAAVRTALSYAAFCVVVLVAGGRSIVSAFTDDPRLAGVATTLLFVAAIFQLADAMNMVARSVLRGSGDVRWPAVVGVVTAWASLPPLTWLLGYQLGLGALGGWLALCVEVVAGAVLLWHRLLRGSWRDAAEASRRASLLEDEARISLVPA
ncbi:MAG: MATE family efflux transporter [Sandaracinus sp.]|nr:MATE family efflux transporter [Sandaracinus sp.]MCB9611691.1 MATE family efflux transporter [Sandaracinus sp.]